MIGTRALALGGVLLLGGVWMLAQGKAVPEESERRVEASEVPRAALDALQKLAGAARIEELAEEVEHGHTFYEGSWRGAHGNVDALVTASGDLVEIEETVPADQVPAAARAVIEKKAGADAKLTWEKKTLVLYESHVVQAGKEHEALLTPDGRPYHEDDEDEHDKD